MKAGVFAAGVAVFLIVAPGAGAGGKTGTTVHLTTLMATGPDSSYYEGSIESPKKSCANDRKVSMYRKADGPDLKLGTTRSERRGNLGYSWAVESSEPLAEGGYYAKAPATKECAGDKTPTIRVAEI
jgi:hypothetical protein